MNVINVILLGSLSFACLGGCKCERDDEHPYTPFGVASTLAPARDGASPTAEAGSEQRFEPTPATIVDPPAAETAIRGTRVSAPDGWLIAQWLDATFVEDGRILAWIVPQQPKPELEAGALWTLGGDAGGEKISSFPPFVPTGKDCQVSTSLSRSGPRSVLLDVSSKCSAHTIARTPNRALTVLRPGRKDRRQLLQLRLAPPFPDDELRVTVTSLDDDGDGHDDVRVKFTLSHAGGKESSAVFAWLERAAGAAREPGEPTKSFSDIGSVEVVRSKGAKTSKLVAERLDSARRLFAYVCEESATYGVSDSQGRPLRCGSLERAFDWYVRAEVQAELTRKRWGHALLALERGDWYGEPRGDKLRDELATTIRNALPNTKATVHRLPARPLGKGSEPRLSPLVFDSAGRLIVQTGAGIMRFESAEDPGANASDEIDPWPLVPFGGRGQRVIGLSFPCDQATVGVVARTPDGRLENAFVSSFLAPRPGQCSQPRPLALPELRINGFDGNQLSGFIGPTAFGEPPAAPPAGSPLSPDGLSSVTTSVLGLLIHAAGGPRLWTVGATLQPEECVIANQGDRVACIDGQSVVWLTPGSGASPTGDSEDSE